MNANLKNSQTKENLMKAFAGESQARNRYTFAAAEARRQNLYSIGHVFEFTAEQERAHAERFYELLKCMAGETIEINAGYPVDKQSTIIELLESSQHNEFEEADDIYISFGNTAKEEGFFEVASAFFQIAEIEKLHTFYPITNIFNENGNHSIGIYRVCARRKYYVKTIWIKR